ncbi:UspA domain-containing protein [Desulfovibrio sp. X2]|uniref:universal stress protein n=1 Tax=Desulfovibrio sp. X2 TaxID=941449 RepID=UPI000358B55B|nr:universal stress protein [Desulfovibrio sp. X2]EPR44264.1 UspA domain-containing protein [Desulfovibrio sp. X2]
MERILVPMDERHGAFEALSHAIFLSGRIAAKIYVLLVLALAGPDSPAAAASALPGDPAGPGAIRKRLESQIETAKAEGAQIDYFVTEGVYAEEVIRFIEHNRITLLIAEGSEGSDGRADRDAAALRKILHRVSCRVEIVTPRKTGQGSAREST